MARKLKRSSRRTRRSKHSKRRHTRRHYGGVAPVGRSDLTWASRVSGGQGMDFLAHHRGQHGGAALVGAALGGDSELLPSSMHQAAGQSGVYRALSEISGMRDQAGGRRRSKRSKRSKHSKKSKRSKHSKRSKRRRHGGGIPLGFSPYPSGGYLLPPAQQLKAGLSGEWQGGVEVEAAANRANL